MLNALAIVLPTMSMGAAVTLMVYLLIGAAIFGLFYFIIGKMPVTEPVRAWLYIALYILSALVAIGWLLSLVGVIR